ncbi:MAG: fatty acid desaturase [Deltaproteobacteria bacterium]|nr:fatty acid desaturase [Deltaproteobacteria bacterium]
MVTARVSPPDAQPLAKPIAAPQAIRRRRGLLRYRADLWSLGWMQVTVALSLLPFVVHMPLWAEGLLLLPVLFFRSSVAYVQHNQSHLGVFWSRPLNFLYDLELALMSGYVTALWEQHHVNGHHRHYLTPKKDPARTRDLRTGRDVSRWHYVVFGNLTVLRDAWRIACAQAAEGRADPRPRAVAQFAVACLVAGALAWRDPIAFAGFILVPNLLVAWGVWHISYDHHLNLPMTSHMSGSHSHLSARFNLLTFNIGHHAAHHEKPTLHWSLLPARSAQILPKLAPESVHGELPRSVTDAARAPERVA